MYLICDNTYMPIGIQTLYHMNQRTHTIPKKHLPDHNISSISLKCCNKSAEFHTQVTFSLYSQPATCIVQLKTWFVWPHEPFPVIYCIILGFLCELDTSVFVQGRYSGFRKVVSFYNLYGAMCGEHFVQCNWCLTSAMLRGNNGKL